MLIVTNGTLDGYSWMINPTHIDVIQFSCKLVAS
jgi:hypothetical protein